MLKWLILFMIITANAAFAEEGDIEVYKPRELIDLSLHLSNTTGDVTSAACNLQIRNSTKDQILNDAMQNTGGGWYNYTYNTSAVGSYFCRYNCSLGSSYAADTCDFVVKGDEKMGLVVMAALILVILVYLWIISNFTTEKLNEHGMIKIALFALVLWALMIPVSFSMATLEDNGGSDRMVSLIDTMYIVMMYLNVAFTAYLVIYMIVSFVRTMQGEKSE